MKYLATILFLCACVQVYAQCPANVSSSCNGSGSSLDLYWVGTDANNNGNWNDPCSWRVGAMSGVEPCQAPRSIDNTFFTYQGFAPSGGSGVVTIQTQARCANFYVNPSVNTLSDKITFKLEDPGFLEVFGSFTLQTGVNWNVVGGSTGPELYFKATTAGQTIDAMGNDLGSVVIDGVGGEWNLQRDIRTDCFKFLFGTFNTNDFDMDVLTFSSHVGSGAAPANRKIILNNSEITVRGTSGNNRYTPYTNWQNPGAWETYNCNPSNTDFQAGGSKIIFPTTSPFIHLGGLNYNVIHHTGTGRFYDHFGDQPCNIDTLTVDGYVFFHHEHNFNVLELTQPGVQHDFFRHQWIATDFIAAGSPCEPTTLSSEYTRYLYLPSSISAPLEGFIVDNLLCSVAGGGTQDISGYGVANTTGWNITTPAARDMYWVGTTNEKYSDPRNWSLSNTGTPVLGLSDCPPTLDDNVFFTAALANAQNVELDDVSRCHDMTWTIDAATTFKGNDPIYIYGDLQLDSDINFTTTSTFYMQGTSNNTILSAGSVFRNIYMQDLSDYTLLDDLEFNNFYLFQHSSFSSGARAMTGDRIYFRGAGATDFSGSTITLDHTNPWQMAGHQTMVSYNSSSRLYFTYAGTADITIRGWGATANAVWPQTEFVSPNPRVIFQDHLKDESVTVQGDLTINCDARFYGEFGSGTTDGALEKVTVIGNLNLNPGKTYEFGLTDELEVQGAINALGPCASDITTVRGINGSAFNADLQGGVNLAHAFIGNMNSVNAHTLNLCTDLGGNSNLTFNPPPAVTTYYWRAASGSCPSCNFNNDWSTPGHWTTNASDTEGSASCIPGPSDNVVFDAASFNGTAQTDIVISSAVSCRDLTVVNSNVKFSGLGAIAIAGSADFDATLDASSFTGAMQFISGSTGKTIRTSGVVLGCEIEFVNENGGWSLLDDFTTTKTFIVNGGAFNTLGNTLTVEKFKSSNNVTRSIDFGSSVVNVKGDGTWTNFGSVSNLLTWDIQDPTNLTLNAGTSTINFTNVSEPVWYSNNVAYHNVNFTSTNQNINTSPVLLGDGNNTQYMRFDCSARIYGNHRYDTLEFTPGNVYVLEQGSEQRLNAPDGSLICSGTPGNEIGIQSTNSGTPAMFFKENTGGSLQSFCFDYVSVQDNFAESDDPAFSFFTGINSDDVSASGIWDFSRPFYTEPEAITGPDVTVCPGGLAEMVWQFEGSGPFNVRYQIGNQTPVDTSISNVDRELVIKFSTAVDIPVEIETFTADYCGSKNTGILVDSTQWALVAEAAPLAQNRDSAICYLENSNAYTHFVEKGGSERPILSVLDRTAGSGLGQVIATTRVDATVQNYNGDIYLQRHYGITPEVEEQAMVRLYFSQTELDELSNAHGYPLALSDLQVTKFDNDAMDFSGAESLMNILNYGTVNSTVTTDDDVYFLEFMTSTFSHFFIHPITHAAPLPVELLTFNAEVKGDLVATSWSTASELNNDRFEVYRSRDAQDWRFVGSVNGAGTSNITNTYELFDFAPFNGVSYYKIKQFDFNGDSKEYPPVAVNYEPVLGVLVYPNPAKDFVNIQLASGQERVVDLVIYTSTGAAVTNREALVLNNESLRIDISLLPPGIYTVRVSDKLTGEPTTTQFVVK